MNKLKKPTLLTKLFFEELYGIVYRDKEKRVDIAGCLD